MAAIRPGGHTAASVPPFAAPRRDGDSAAVVLSAQTPPACTISCKRGSERISSLRGSRRSGSRDATFEGNSHPNDERPLTGAVVYAAGGTRTPTGCCPIAPEAIASANSATAALALAI